MLVIKFLNFLIRLVVRVHAISFGAITVTIFDNVMDILHLTYSSVTSGLASGLGSSCTSCMFEFLHTALK